MTAEIVMAISLWCDNGGIMKEAIDARKACKHETVLCITRKASEKAKKDSELGRVLYFNAEKALWECL